MEIRGFEPLTLGLQSRCSSQLSYIPAHANIKIRERKIRNKGRNRCRTYVLPVSYTDTILPFS